jgi:outer membrane protein OmpA-like peptidoglycan-associated protein
MATNAIRQIRIKLHNMKFEEFIQDLTSPYYRKRLRRVSKIVISSFVFLIALSSGTQSAESASLEAQTNNIYVNLAVSQNPDLSLGSNEFNSLKYVLRGFPEGANGNLQIINGNKTFAFANNENTANLIGYLNLNDATYLEDQLNNQRRPIPVIINGNLNLGQVTFVLGKAKLTQGGIQILKMIAKEIVNSNLHAIYLVGNADNTGNSSINLLLSHKRVMLVSKILYDYVNNEGGYKIDITTEFMSNYLAKGPKGLANENDRSVSVLLYPNTI